jgi:hypothetical protein
MIYERISDGPGARAAEKYSGPGVNYASRLSRPLKKAK